MYMERTMSVEEKIKKAEEIYNRRNENVYSKKDKKEPSFTKRLVKQIIICLLVYGVFYVVTNREYFLSEEFRGKVEEVATKNQVLNNTYNYVMSFVEKHFNQGQVENEESNELEVVEEKNEENQNIAEENIGGSEEDFVEVEQEKTEEENDIEYIKNNINFILPIEGTISSTFGWRNPTTRTVPKYHTGLDIAAEKGTIIKSATDGTVILASQEGDYGNHYKVQINDIIIIYAHCNKLYLKEGDTVSQGQEIAEVGSTGNATGSHLHFEIRRGDRLIDPQTILNF